MEPSLLKQTIAELEGINPAKFSFLKDFWNEVTVPADPTTTGIQLEEHFLRWLLKQDKLCSVLSHVLFKELGNARQNSILREDSVAATFLSTLWYKIEGKDYLKKIIAPLAKDIGNSDLELDPKEIVSKGCKMQVVKKNLEELLAGIDKFLKRIYSSYDDFPRKFVIILQKIDRQLSKRFGTGLSVVGGVLTLRLINPSIIFPEKYGIVEEGVVSAEGRKSLITAAKILQKLSNAEVFNEERKALMASNRFIKRQGADWNKFFHKMITGQDLSAREAPLDALKIDPEDLISKSNQDVTMTCPVHLGKQYELTERMLNLEKETEGWEAIKKKGIDTYVKVFKGTGKTPLILAKSVDEFPNTVKEVYQFLVDHPMEKHPDIYDYREVERFNDNLRVNYFKHKMAFPMDDRDFLTLSYNEILPADDFAMIASMSMERDDVPHLSKLVRGEIVVGILIRGTADPNRSICTTVYHLDLKGHADVLPTALLKHDAVKIQIHEHKRIQQLIESQRIRRHSRSLVLSPKKLATA